VEVVEGHPGNVGFGLSQTWDYTKVDLRAQSFN